MKRILLGANVIIASGTTNPTRDNTKQHHPVYCKKQPLQTFSMTFRVLLSGGRAVSLNFAPAIVNHLSSEKNMVFANLQFLL